MLALRHPRALLALTAALLGAFALTGAALALGLRPFDQTTGSAKKLLAVKTVTSPDLLFFNSVAPTYTDITSVPFSVPGNVPSALVTAAFQTSSDCNGSQGGEFCLIRILIDGNEMQPGHSAIDSVPNDGFVDVSEAHALDRSQGGIGPGNHTLTVQAAVTGNTTLAIDDYDLKVEVYK